MNEFQKAETGGNIKTAGDVIKKVVNDIINRKEGVLKGLPTGFAELDNTLSGLNCGNLIAIAGHHGIGTTCLALNICEHLSIDMNIPVLYLALQDSIARLTERILFGRSKIDLSKAAHCFLRNNEMELLKQTGIEIMPKPLFIDDTSRLSLSEIKERAKKMKESKGIKCLVVDYLQAIRLQDKIDLNEADLTQVSKELKLVALELNLPVILLVELSFDLIRKDEEIAKPRIADLGKAIGVERYADCIMLINRESYFCFEEHCCRNAEIIITKNANGHPGIVYLKFWHEFSRFTDPTVELKEE